MKKKYFIPTMIVIGLIASTVAYEMHKITRGEDMVISAIYFLAYVVYSTWRRRPTYNINIKSIAVVGEGADQDEQALAKSISKALMDAANS